MTKCNCSSFKRKFSLVSLAILASLLSAPQTQAMKAPTDDAELYYSQSLKYLSAKSSSQDMRKKNEQKALYFRKLAALEEHPIAEFELSTRYSNKPRKQDKHIRFLTASATHGHHVAQSCLAYNYEKGTKIAQDLKKAFQLYELSADQGNISSQLKLARIYLDPTCKIARAVQLPLDIRKSVSLLENVALSSLRTDAMSAHAALYKVGCKYERGEGVEKDKIEALRLFNLASEGGNEEATRKIGLHYLKGPIETRDYKKAAQLFKKISSKEGINLEYYHQALHQNFLLAQSHYQGAEGEINIQKAIELLRFSAAENHQASRDLLSRILREEPISTQW